MFKWLHKIFSKEHQWFFCIGFTDENTNLEYEISLCETGKTAQEAYLKALDSILKYAREKRGFSVNEKACVLKKHYRVN